MLRTVSYVEEILALDTGVESLLVTFSALGKFALLRLLQGFSGKLKTKKKKRRTNNKSKQKACVFSES